MNHGRDESRAVRRRNQPIVWGMMLVLLLALTAWGIWRVMSQRPENGETHKTPAATPKTPADQAHPATPAQQPDQGSRPPEQEPRWAELRRQMVQQQLRGRDITDPRVLEVMQRVPRHRFVAEHLVDLAYTDQALPIAHGQTISQPYIVALMTQLARPKPDDRALDVGTGSGYQTAVLAELCKEVYSIEIIEPLAEEARRRLQQLGYRNIEVRSGDGYRGWPEHAPFDLIIVAAAPDHVPQPLVQQLAPGGRLVIPVGSYLQDLLVVEKQQDGTARQWKVVPVAFVPMTGEAQHHKPQ